jgi:predicted regulator of Ras-like GTPase activity (Roadblock/LC7/MglB family)
MTNAMSDFNERLRSIVHAVDGAVAATIMGVDGIPVQAYEAEASDDVDVSSLLVEYSSLIPQVQRSAQMFAAGGLEELSIRSERLVTIIRPVNAEYFLALALKADANHGKGRYLLRVHAPKLAGALS